MWLQVVYLLEVFATLACIHSIYGEKLRWNVKPIVFCMSLMVVLEVLNSLPNGRIYSWVVYVPIAIYCKCAFENSLLQTIVKMIWLIILLTAIEFICVLLVVSVFKGDITKRNVIVNVLVLIVSVVILPKTHIDRVRLSDKKAKVLVGVILGIISLLIFEDKFANRINMTLFVLVVPTILVLLYAIVKWTFAQVQADDLRREMHIANKMDEKYLELVDHIRIKQHGFKNHITAILSSHYTYKTYERLVEVQEEYCNRLLQENKYNNLLQVGDKVLVGFLYEKFQEIEADGVAVRYEINTIIKDYSISTYHLIEMLGILLDNATEAVKHTEMKNIVFKISESNDIYLFSISNISEYVPYSEIEKWFIKGASSKGRDRGLGLYHIKNLCRELNCNIYCRNKEIEEDNWIEFGLEISKADRE